MPDATTSPPEAEPSTIAAVDAKELPGGGLDGTIGLMRDGYRFISNRCERYATDVFRTRIMGREVVCMRGEAAARLFYDGDRFRRRGAVPSRLRKTLFGGGGIHGLDGETHRARKQMFLSVLSEGPMHRFVQTYERMWREAIGEWERPGRIVLLDEAARVLCRAACGWAGIPLKQWETTLRTQDIMAMIDGAGSYGLRHWQGRQARKRAERWMQKNVEAVRLRQEEDRDEALHVFTWHRDPDGTLPDKQTVAVELLNLLIGIVAVAYYVALCGLCLDAHPEWRRRLRDGDDLEAERFAEEIRRVYPLMPFVTATVRDGFEWNGYRFPEGRKVMLDLYGTNRHPDSWEAPDAFHPDRFTGAREDKAYDFIPHGVPDPHNDHSCPGEELTLEIIKASLRGLTRRMAYEVPAQDLQVDLRVIPARPASGFVMKHVRRMDETGGSVR